MNNNSGTQARSWSRHAPTSKQRAAYPKPPPSIGEVLDAALVLVKKGAMSQDGYAALAQSLMQRHLDDYADEIWGTAAQVELERGVG